MPEYNINTFSRHIVAEQQDHHPGAHGNFSWLLSGISLACKIIGEEVRRLGLSSAAGPAEGINVHGEQQQGLDVFANKVLMDCLGSRGNVGLLASEENEEPVVIVEHPEQGEYIVVFDPLDGSSNLDVNVSVGTIFSIFRRSAGQGKAMADEVLQSGRQQVAAGYVAYGSSTVLVYTTGHGVHGFTLDPAIGTFVLSHPDMKLPARGMTYSVNEAYADGFPPYCRRFLHWLKSGEDEATLSLAVHRLTGVRLPPHAAEGRHLHVSAHVVLSRRQVAVDVRGQSDRLPGRASRRPGHERHRADSRSRAQDIAPARATVRRQPPRNGQAARVRPTAAESLKLPTASYLRHRLIPVA